MTVASVCQENDIAKDFFTSAFQSEMCCDYLCNNHIARVKRILVDGALMAKYAGYKNETAEKMIDVIAMSGANKTQLGVTNLTNIELKAEYDSFKVQDFIFLAAPMSTTRDVVAVCTLENKMNFCYSTVKKVK